MMMMVVVVVPTPTTTDITPRGHDEPILDSTVRFLRSTSLRLLVLNRNGQWRIQLGHSLPDFHPLILGGSFLLFLIPSDRRIHHSRRNRTGSFPDWRTCCCWFRDRTNNSLWFFLFSTCLLFILFNRSTTKKTHLNVPTQPNWRWPWLLGDDFRPLQIHPTDTGQFRRTRKDLHHTPSPTSSAHTFVAVALPLSLFNFDCFRIVSGAHSHIHASWGLSSSSASSCSCFASRLFASWVITVKMHTLKCSTNVHSFRTLLKKKNFHDITIPSIEKSFLATSAGR